MSSHPPPTALIEHAAVDADAEVGGLDVTLSSQVAACPAGAAAAYPARPTVTLDPVAVELARAAAVAEAGTVDHIGEFRSAFAEDDVAVTAMFAATQRGYLGWQWSVTLAMLAPEHPTVSEVVLLPGPGALLAPSWIPWDQRIRPGDVGVGDLLPATVDDPRLSPAYLQSDDPAVEAVAAELGIGRVRVLSREGRIEFAERLHEGSFGPSDEMAIAAPGRCFTCAFYLPLAGLLGGLIGACGNEFAPADGRVVDAGYGCGAHSETVIQMPARSATADTVVDELSLEVHRHQDRRRSPEWNEMPGTDVGEQPPEVQESLLDGDEAVLVDALDAEPVDPDLIGAELADQEQELAGLPLDVLEQDAREQDPRAQDPPEQDPTAKAVEAVRAVEAAQAVDGGEVSAADEPPPAADSPVDSSG